MIEINLGTKIVNQKSDPYLIAEIGVNHEGDLESAKKLIYLAKKGGADAVKFQTYKAEKLAAKESPYYWDINKEPTRNQHELFKKYDGFEDNEYKELAAFSKELNIEFISTPFDESAVDILNELMPYFKISSSDITNVPLLRKIGSKGKPVILSTGASNQEEIDYAIAILENCGIKDIALLHCILNYPTEVENANLKMIAGLIKQYPNRIIGYSDHTLPNKGLKNLVQAYNLGAVIIEKHFTDDKTKSGNDHYHAMDMQDIIDFRNEIEFNKKLLGESEIKHAIDSEATARLNARRSVVAIGQIKKGERLTSRNLITKRPASGISAKYWDKVIGMKARIDMEDDHIIRWDEIE